MKTSGPSRPFRTVVARAALEHVRAARLDRRRLVDQRVGVVADQGVVAGAADDVLDVLADAVVLTGLAVVGDTVGRKAGPGGEAGCSGPASGSPCAPSDLLGRCS